MSKLVAVLALLAFATLSLSAETQVKVTHIDEATREVRFHLIAHSALIIAKPQQALTVEEGVFYQIRFEKGHIDTLRRNRIGVKRPNGGLEWYRIQTLQFLEPQ